MHKSSIQIFIENMGLTLMSVIKILILSRRSPLRKRKLVKDHCIIMGNGPSLTDTINTLGEKLNNTELFCVNHFAETGLYESLKPAYYVISAPELWLTNVDKVHTERGIKLFGSIAEKTNWELNLYIPFTARKYKPWKNLILGNQHVKVNYFNATPIEGFKWFIRIALAQAWGLPRPHNVLIPTILAACNLGHKSIYILGAENSFFKDLEVTDNNEVLITHKHFYDSENRNKGTMHNLGLGSRKIHEVLQKFVYSFKGYWVLREYAETIGCNIYNATPDSYIDAFKKIKTENILLKEN